jgi:hypothetical protein
VERANLERTVDVPQHGLTKIQYANLDCTLAKARALVAMEEPVRKLLGNLAASWPLIFRTACQSWFGEPTEVDFFSPVIRK